jgi:hypothetical protein
LERRAIKAAFSTLATKTPLFFAAATVPLFDPFRCFRLKILVRSKIRENFCFRPVADDCFLLQSSLGRGGVAKPRL